MQTESGRSEENSFQVQHVFADTVADVSDSASTVSDNIYGVAHASLARSSGSIVSSSTNTTSTSSSVSSTSAKGLLGVQEKVKELFFGWCVMAAKSSMLLAWPAFLVQSIQLFSFLLDPHFPWGNSEGITKFLQAVSFLRTLNVNDNYRTLYQLLAIIGLLG